MSVSERFYAGVYGKYLGENVGKKIAYLYTTDGAGIAFAKQLQEYMKKNYNVDPVYEAQMQETDLDFRSHLLKIKSLNPEILAIGGQADALARQAQQSFEVGIPKSVWRVAASSAGNVTYPKLAGDAAVGTTFTQAFNCTDERPIAKQFVAMVKQKYKFPCPDHDFSQAWDAAQIAKIRSVAGRRLVGSRRSGGHGRDRRINCCLRGTRLRRKIGGHSLGLLIGCPRDLENLRGVVGAGLAGERLNLRRLLRALAVSAALGTLTSSTVGSERSGRRGAS